MIQMSEMEELDNELESDSIIRLVRWQGHSSRLPKNMFFLDREEEEIVPWTIELWQAIADEEAPSQVKEFDINWDEIEEGFEEREFLLEQFADN